jgi:NAD(P)-dependent dehydrogenase (short-subunit alcohol dehydrogenase family)
MVNSLLHKIAMVTGANSGIGAATVRAFAECGARVGLQHSIAISL